MLYKVECQERKVYQLNIEADSEDEAIEIANKKLSNPYTASDYEVKCYSDIEVLA